MAAPFGGDDDLTTFPDAFDLSDRQSLLWTLIGPILDRQCRNAESIGTTSGCSHGLSKWTFAYTPHTALGKIMMPFYHTLSIPIPWEASSLSYMYISDVFLLV